MNIREILGIIEENRKLTEMNSLPFAKYEDGKVVICWFSFEIKESNEKLVLSVERLFKLNGAKMVDSVEADYSYEFDENDFVEPTITENEYLSRLEMMLSNNDFSKLMFSLTEVSEKYLLKAYQYFYEM